MKKTELQRLLPRFGLKNKGQLETILLMENGRSFHPDLISELVSQFGTNGLINFDQFYNIWCHLAPLRSKFEEFGPSNGVLTSEKFKILVQEHLGHTVNSASLDMLTSFYTNLAFDAFVHCVRNLKEISSELEISTCVVSWETYYDACTKCRPKN